MDILTQTPQSITLGVRRWTLLWLGVAAFLPLLSAALLGRHGTTLELTCTRGLTPPCVLRRTLGPLILDERPIATLRGADLVRQTQTDAARSTWTLYLETDEGQIPFHTSPDIPRLRYDMAQIEHFLRKPDQTTLHIEVLKPLYLFIFFACALGAAIIASAAWTSASVSWQLDLKRGYLLQRPNPFATWQPFCPLHRLQSVGLETRGQTYRLVWLINDAPPVPLTAVFAPDFERQQALRLTLEQAITTWRARPQTALED